MADIQISASLKGQASAKASAGLRFSVAAQCLGIASSGHPLPPPPEEPKPKGS